MSVRLKLKENWIGHGTGGKLAQEMNKLCKCLNALVKINAETGESTFTEDGLSMILVSANGGVQHPWKVTFNGSTFDVASGSAYWWKGTTGAYDLQSANASGIVAGYKCIYAKLTITSDTSVALTIAAVAGGRADALALASSDGKERILPLATIATDGSIVQLRFSDWYLGRES